MFSKKSSNQRLSKLELILKISTRSDFFIKKSQSHKTMGQALTSSFSYWSDTQGNEDLEFNDGRKWEKITDCGIKERDINGHHLSKQICRFFLDGSEGNLAKIAFQQSRIIDEQSIDTVEIYTGGGGKETKIETKLTKVEVAKFEDNWNKLWNLWIEPTNHRVWNGPGEYHK